MYDIVIIGSGVSGAAAARELSRYQADICVLEKEEDVCLIFRCGEPVPLFCALRNRICQSLKLSATEAGQME